jgi:RNA polymerase sigma factor (TIGR02999 family)
MQANARRLQTTDCDITTLLHAWREGDSRATERLMPLVYEELRVLAGRCMAGERKDHTLQPTALVHEAFLRLSGGVAPDWRDRVHFFAVAARVMRRLLVDHARARRTAKRDGGLVVPLEEAGPPGQGSTPDRLDLLALDEALARLSDFDDRKARSVELRYFGGLTLEEISEALGVSRPTVILDLRLARAWLFRHLAEEAVS